MAIVRVAPQGLKAMRNDFDQDDGFTENGRGSDDDAIWSRLSAYADGEVTPEEAAAVERLLCSDFALSRDFALIRRAGDAARTLPEIEPPMGLRQAIFAATIQRQSPADRLVTAWKRFCIALAPPPRRLALAGSVAVVVGLAALLLPLAHQGGRTRVPDNLIVLVKPHGPTSVAPEGFPDIPDPDAIPGLNARTEPDVPLIIHRIGERSAVAVATSRRYHAAPPAVAVVLRPRTEPITGVVSSGRSHHTGGTSRIPVEVVDYSVMPNMDQGNQHLSAGSGASLAVHRETDVPGKDLVAAENTAEMPATPASSPALSPAIPTQDPPVASHSAVRIARVSQLPPATFVVPTAELRRQMEARNLNFNTATMEGLRRREATLTLISTHF